MMRLLSMEDVERVARNLCPRHARNVCMLSFADDPVAAAMGVMWANPIGVSFWRDGEPVAVGGAVITHPNNASTFFFGTPAWPKCLLEISRFYHHDLRDTLTRAGVRRVSVFAPAGDPEGERWKKLLKCELEAVLKGFGKNGEDFSLFTAML